MTAEEPAEAPLPALLLSLAAERGAGSFCPSEAARRLDPANWRGRMTEVREAAAALAAAGRLVATQRGVPVDPRTARGPIRLRAVRA